MYGIVRWSSEPPSTKAASAIDPATTVGAHRGKRRSNANGIVQPSASSANRARSETSFARKASTTEASAKVRTSASTARARIWSKTPCMRGRYRRARGHASSLQATAKSSSRTTRIEPRADAGIPSRDQGDGRRSRLGLRKEGTRMSAVLPKGNDVAELADERVLHEHRDAIVAARDVARRYGS